MLRKNRVGYDELAYGLLVGEYNQSGNLIQEIIWLNDIPVATIRTDQGGTGVGVFYVHTDHLNAPTKITRPTNNAVIWRWDHDPYGNGTPNQDPDGNGLQLTMNICFPGQYYDQETGLYNYFRDYDPATGRYIESDPIELYGGSFSTYSYVNNNAVMLADPTGLTPWDWDGIGDTSACEYYEKQAAATSCSYYKDAAQACRGQKTSINLMMRAWSYSGMDYVYNYRLAVASHVADTYASYRYGHSRPEGRPNG